MAFYPQRTGSSLLRRVTAKRVKRSCRKRGLVRFLVPFFWGEKRQIQPVMRIYSRYMSRSLGEFDTSLW